MSKTMAATLEEAGIDHASKRQRVEETVSDLISRTAEKAAHEAASLAADAAIDKCNAFWQAKFSSHPDQAKVQPETESAASPKKPSTAVTTSAAEATPNNGESRCHSCTADEACMQTAASSARVGVRLEHGGPFGASIVRNGVVISCSHNMVLANADPTCHAEMTAIRYACKALGTYDLSDCDLYTTCEPCPMCWGAVQWSRLGKAYIGVDRHTAARYGFDDKVFYDEIADKSGVYGWKRYGYRKDASAGTKVELERIEKNMVEVYDGILRPECEALFTNPKVNKTFRRRYMSGTEDLRAAAKIAFPDAGVKRKVTAESSPHTSLAQHEHFMRMAVAAAERCAQSGLSKEREPFGVVIVKDGVVIATACNSVCSSRDATATAEINAIQAATVNLGKYSLEGCEMYTTVQPDVMSLGAILWSRISRVYCGVTQKFAAQYGFEEGTLHFKDLLEAASGHKFVEVVEGVAVEECEAVFKEWSDRNGVVY